MERPVFDTLITGRIQEGLVYAKRPHGAGRWPKANDRTCWLLQSLKYGFSEPSFRTIKIAPPWGLVGLRVHDRQIQHVLESCCVRVLHQRYETISPVKVHVNNFDERPPFKATVVPTFSPLCSTKCCIGKKSRTPHRRQVQNIGQS